MAMETEYMLIGCLATAAIVCHTVLALQTSSVPRILATVRSVREKFRFLWRGSSREHNNDDIVDQEVARLMAIRKVSMFKKILPACSITCFAISCQLLFHNFFGQQPEWITLLGDLTFFVFYFIILLLMFKPNLVSSRSLDMWCSLLMLVTIIFMSPLVYDGGMAIIATVSTSALRFWCGLCMKQSLYIFWTVVWLSVLCLHFLGPLQCECSRDLFDVFKVLSSEGTSCFAFLVIKSLLVGFMEDSARLEIESRASRTGLTASKALLGTLCDAVLELDKDMRLKTFSPTFCTLLLLPANHPPAGTKLDRFMQSENDKCRFYQNMSQASSEKDAMADAFHVKMVDSNGSPIEVEFFHVCCNDSLTGLPQHLVGIREHSDFYDKPLRQPMGDAVGTELEIVFDAVSFDIISCSTHFSLCYGPFPAGASVEDWWCQEEERLLEYTSFVNNFFISHDPVCLFSLDPLALRLPRGDRGPGPKLSPRVSFMLTRSEEEDGNRPSIVTKMTLSPRDEVDALRGSSRSSRTRSSQGRRARGAALVAGRGTPADAGPRQGIQDPQEMTLVVEPGNSGEQEATTCI